MAVFTPVSLVDLSDWITQFPLGKALAITNISSGIENSNFFINTENGEYVLTLFEKLNFKQLPFYLKLMRHLAMHGILVPTPIANCSGNMINFLNGKPAAIFTKLEGMSQIHPTLIHCTAVGNMLGKMHVAAQNFSIRQPNLRGLSWWSKITPIVLPFMTSKNQELLRTEIKFQQTFAASELPAQLPNGPVHADLFRDNAMFVDTRLTGFFDFYFAGCDSFLFDLAITVNDWCIDFTSGEFDLPRLKAMLDAYYAVRPFTNLENHVWQTMLRGAALRFWLSRLYDFYFPRHAKVLMPHNPEHFERILRLRINRPIPTLNIIL